ncbi:hypothetical protein HWV62_4343 [Athelia sp. TMB]|nr:hypothetical protein HWV62_4343 [Athelia sp. TMB]
MRIEKLDATRLRSSDFIDIGAVMDPTLRVGDSRVHLHYVNQHRSGFPNVRRPFPQSTRGFFYFHAPSDQPEITWQVRFRVTETSSPASFKSGSDLLYPNLTPWCIRLSTIDSQNPLRELLLRDGLIAEAVTAIATNVDTKNGMRALPMIHSLGQTFNVDFQRTTLDAIFCANSHHFKYRMHTPFATPKSTSETLRRNPYAGSALCCFEAHKSTSSNGMTYDNMAIRILKLTEPVTVVEPELAHKVPWSEEGQLAMIYKKAGYMKLADPRPWTLTCRAAANPVIRAILQRSSLLYDIPNSFSC